MWNIIKKDNTLEEFNPNKIIIAVSKSADRVGVTLTERNKKDIIHYVKSGIEESGLTDIPIIKIHNFVECALDTVNPNVAKSYRDYRNYKEDFVHRFNSVYKFAQSTIFLGDDKNNANTDASLVSTKRSLIYQHLNKELYQKFFLRTDELQACRDGYIYIHDMGARRDTFNCFSRDTRFITSEGVKSFYDFSDGDEIEVYSHKKNKRKAVVHSYGKQTLNKITFKKTFKVNDIFKVSECIIKATANHRWILINGDETTNLKIGDVLYNTDNSSIYNIDDMWFVYNIEPWNNGIEEEVWCLEVEDDHSFLLEGGIPTGNCCLFDVGTVLNGGFEMANVWYNEPKSIETAFNVISDLVPNVAANQYGGITLPEIDTVLEPYCIKSYDLYREEILDTFKMCGYNKEDLDEKMEIAIHDKVMDKLYNALLKGFQGFEYKFNTVGSSRGDYPFIAMTFGLSDTEIGKLINKAILETRKNGQGKAGYKKPVLFPKLIFLYDEDKHDVGKPCEDVFDAAIECSKTSMYP